MEQAVHTDSVVPVEYFASAHFWQMVLLMYVPAWHVVQELADPSELVFAGHARHVLSVPSTK
jgi:hypothetical protein